MRTLGGFVVEPETTLKKDDSTIDGFIIVDFWECPAGLMVTFKDGDRVFDKPRWALDGVTMWRERI